MSDPNPLEVMIDGQLIECSNIDDKMRLEPVGGILADRSTEGYRREELEAMVATLDGYKLSDLSKRLKELMAKK